MSDPAYFTVDQINAVADHVIAELKDDPGSVIALPIPHGLTARDRANLLSHHGAVVREIRKRGWLVKTHVRHTPAGSVFAIDLEP
jgi:hypothetical protein